MRRLDDVLGIKDSLLNLLCAINLPHMSRGMLVFVSFIREFFLVSTCVIANQSIDLQYRLIDWLLYDTAFY